MPSPLNFNSTMSEKPIAFDDADQRSVSDSESEYGLPPSLPHAPTGPRTGRPQPARRVDNKSRSQSQASEDERWQSERSDDHSDIPQIAKEDCDFEEKVGAGITAEVFRGTCNGKVVAIKQFNLFKGRCAEMKQQVAFCREIRVAAKVRHKNLVQLYGVCFDHQPYLMITEFLSGGTVFDLLHNNEAVDLTWKQRLHMCSDVASAMDYLHKFDPQIIHRDLKSLNLLLSKAITHSGDVPEVKVSDFGLAKIKDSEEWGRMTAAAGTFHWMAPEVYGGQYTENADVYSYAMVLFEIICDEVPFEEMGPSEVRGAVCSGVRPTLDAVPPTCPEKLRELMIASWAQDAGRRPSFARICTVLNRISV